MARPVGTRNPEYEERRRALLAKLQARLVKRNGVHPSYRELAAACEASIPTLRHYFGRREDVVAAVMAEYLEEGREHLERLAVADAPFAASVRSYLDYVLMGLRRGVSEIFTLGLIEGLRNDRLGPACLDGFLEPTLRSLEKRLAAHQERGEMRAEANLRHAALGLLSPVLLAYAHQTELGGSALRALDMEAFVAELAEAFIRAYGA